MSGCRPLQSETNFGEHQGEYTKAANCKAEARYRLPCGKPARHSPDSLLRHFCECGTLHAQPFLGLSDAGGGLKFNAVTIRRYLFMHITKPFLLVAAAILR